MLNLLLSQDDSDIDEHGDDDGVVGDSDDSNRCHLHSTYRVPGSVVRHLSVLLVLISLL